MKKSILIIVLSFYVFSVTELHQLFKLPQLFTHFIEHKEQNSKTTFSQFLFMHYANGDAKDADDEKDMKLPFKSHDDCFNTVLIAFVPNTVDHFSKKPVYPENKSYSIYTEDFSFSAHLNSIWQPPKSC